MYFKDRTSAGIALGGIIVHQHYHSPIIFALPRGGVPVAAKVSNILEAPFEIITVRKLGMPFDPEFAFGAIAPESVITIDQELVKKYGVSEAQITNILDKEKSELDRRSRLYGSWIPTNLEDNTAIIIDDGIATGRTMLAAVNYLKRYSPEKIVVATPVVSSSAIALLKDKCIKITYLMEDDFFTSVKDYYDEFPQISDKEVLAIIKKYPSKKSSPRI